MRRGPGTYVSTRRAPEKILESKFKFRMDLPVVAVMVMTMTVSRIQRTPIANEKERNLRPILEDSIHGYTGWDFLFGKSECRDKLEQIEQDVQGLLMHEAWLFETRSKKDF